MNRLIKTKFASFVIGLLLGGFLYSAYNHKWYVVNAPETTKVENSIKKQTIKDSPGATNQIETKNPCPCQENIETLKKKKGFLFFGKRDKL